ncbi:type IV secretion system protein [Cupriavidus sp. D39]|uniref:type IV secretion system protein n=1 Tax=Cupriavidus sp. D39 TaxID=2997877 RepID=UPI002271B525|nr:type IV secretion system protein [Cupriavidus sp. D39]MCY0852651.1 type IV secretion system protein [Cupriavidus sp. D39]
MTSSDPAFSSGSTAWPPEDQRRSGHILRASIVITAGKFWDSFLKIATSAFKPVEPVLKSFVAAIILFLGLLLRARSPQSSSASSSMLGELQVAVGVVVGPIAVALAFSSFTRRYFTAWLDYMFSGSLYIVVAAIISRLVTAAHWTRPSVASVTAGTDTGGGRHLRAGHFRHASPDLARDSCYRRQAVRNGRRGVSGGGALRAAGRGAWKLGSKMVM